MTRPTGRRGTEELLARERALERDIRATKRRIRVLQGQRPPARGWLSTEVVLVRELAPLDRDAHEHLTAALFEETGVAEPVAWNDGVGRKRAPLAATVRIEDARSDAPKLAVHETLVPARALFETLCFAGVGILAAVCAGVRVGWLGAVGAALVVAGAVAYYRRRSATELAEERRELEAFVHRLAARALGGPRQRRGDRRSRDAGDGVVAEPATRERS